MIGTPLLKKLSLIFQFSLALKTIFSIKLQLFLQHPYLILQTSHILLMLIPRTLRSLPILLFLNLHPLLLGHLPLLLLTTIHPLLLDRLDFAGRFLEKLLVVRGVAVRGGVALLFAHVDR